MKPSKLYENASKRAARSLDIRLESRERYEALTSELGIRVGAVMDEFQYFKNLFDNTHHRPGSEATLPFEYFETEVAEVPGSALAVQKKLLIVEVPAGKLFDSLVHADDNQDYDFYYRLRLYLAVTDLEFVGGRPQREKQRGASIDLVTELRLGVWGVDRDEEADIMDSPEVSDLLDDFQVLERVNWMHPVLGDADLQNYHDDNPFSGVLDLDSQTIAEARFKSVESDPLSVVSGVHASLDQIEEFLRSYKIGRLPHLPGVFPPGVFPPGHIYDESIDL